MRLTFQTERWSSSIEGEIWPLFYLNWLATGRNRELIPVDCDWDAYRACAGLRVTTARNGSELVGYFLNDVRYHPHYKSTLFAFMDIYFLKEDFRTGANGMRLFLEAERDQRRLGVVEAIANSKVMNDISPLFECMGWEKTGIIYTKLLI